MLFRQQLDKSNFYYMPITLTESHRKLIGNIFLSILIMGFVAAIWGTIVRINEGVSETKEELLKNGQLMVQDLDHELDIYIQSLLAMKYTSERYFSGRTQGAENPVMLIRALREYAGYESVVPENFNATDTVGRITGFGKLPKLNDPIAKEMEMAVGLTPVMRAIRARGQDVPWVQYASARGFMHIFPLQGSEQFHFKPELMRRDYFARATPQANPIRKIFWSSPYSDAAGRGQIITATQPIYENDTFRGSVSVDVFIASLQRILSSSTISKTHVHLTDHQGTVITASSIDPDDSFEKQHHIVQLNLRSAPWVVELHMNQDDLLIHSLNGRTWHIITLLVLAICLITVILLTRKSRQIHEISIRDGLTGLYNRRHFDQVAQQQFELSQRHKHPIALAIMDIDFFKKFNDHYGHQEGDKALCAVAMAIQSVLKRNSDLLFRVGGEEFAVLATISNQQELGIMMKKVNQAVRDLHLPHISNPSGFISISIGATLTSTDQWISVDAAYKKADDCLYQAKSNGRNQAVISSI